MSLLRVGIVGTGYVARLRAEAFQGDRRCQIVGIAGSDRARTQAISQTYDTQAYPDWQTLLAESDLDLVVIATVNRDHGTIAQAALHKGKQVVVEYPLALNLTLATELVAFAQAQKHFLHVEHIELLGGLHQALLANLPALGTPHFVSYTTWKAEDPAPQRWTYHPQGFGFPFMGALSRIQRLTHAFGEVETVTCQAQFLAQRNSLAENPETEPDFPDCERDQKPGSLNFPKTSYFRTCLCQAQLQFKNGMLAQVSYAKGEGIWRSQRTLEVYGDRGALHFEPVQSDMRQEQGTLITPDGCQTIEVASRRGLFAQDTQQILDYLFQQKPLYISLEESLYALKVADAARRSAENGQSIKVDGP